MPCSVLNLDWFTPLFEGYDIKKVLPILIIHDPPSPMNITLLHNPISLTKFGLHDDRSWQLGKITIWLR